MGGRVWAVEDVDVDEAESVWPFAVAVIVSSSGLMRSSAGGWLPLRAASRCDEWDWAGAAARNDCTDKHEGKEKQ